MVDPFLKWPGGKRWLASRLEGLFPESFDRYVEPFVGGGAVFFRLAPKKAVLADTNAELINSYRQLRAHPIEIERSLATLHQRHSKELYYRIRTRKPSTLFDRAVRFIYLNRTCFNGIYRVNKQGEFNVPAGSKRQVAYEVGFLETVARTLRRASLRVSDFEATLAEATVGDFVFVDPPYTVMHNNNNFVKYNAHLFSWADQERLAGALEKASSRGALVMLSNADHASVRALYRGFGEHRKVKRSTVLAADSSHRRGTSELLITNY